MIRSFQRIVLLVSTLAFRCAHAASRRESQAPHAAGPVAAIAMVFVSGCSLQQFAIDRVGNALASEGESFASDDDPELVGAAIPFGLKLTESVLEQSPHHEGLLLAAARGFTQYGYAWVEEKDQARAVRMYLRAREYGLRGLEVSHPHFREHPIHAMPSMTRRDVPLLYWTATSWGLAISLSKDRPELVADLPVVEAMIDRALVLDEEFDRGAIHSFLITYELTRPGGAGDPQARSRAHYERAIALSGGSLASPYVTFAESVSVASQNREEFESLLAKALAIDCDAVPQWRLENRIAQERARRLLARADELFLASEKGAGQ